MFIFNIFLITRPRLFLLSFCGIILVSLHVFLVKEFLFFCNNNISLLSHGSGSVTSVVYWSVEWFLYLHVFLVKEFLSFCFYKTSLSYRSQIVPILSHGPGCVTSVVYRSVELFHCTLHYRGYQRWFTGKHSKTIIVLKSFFSREKQSTENLNVYMKIWSKQTGG